MENGNRLDCAALRNMDMVDYLAAIGITASKIRGNDFRYHSPFRAERTASFKVNRKLNRWYDFGEGRGGNLIDFAIRYYDCSIADLLRMSRTDLSILRPHHPSAPLTSVRQSNIRVLEADSIRSGPLLRYLCQRRIPVAIADQYCREVKFLMNGKHLYGIGFPNGRQGYEIRTPSIKSSTSPKDITTIETGAPELCVFEGFFDFLSLVALQPAIRANFLVLNSLSFFERARPFMERHQTVRLFLDNDNAGKNFTTYALSLAACYQDESPMYHNYNDLNDWLCGIRPPP